MGEFEGTSINVDKKLFLDNNHTPPKGESITEVDNRDIDFLNMLKENYNDRKVLVVTHNGVIRSFSRILNKDFKRINNLQTLTFNID